MGEAATSDARFCAASIAPPRPGRRALPFGLLVPGPLDIASCSPGPTGGGNHEATSCRVPGRSSG